MPETILSNPLGLKPIEEQEPLLEDYEIESMGSCDAWFGDPPIWAMNEHYMRGYWRSLDKLPHDEQGNPLTRTKPVF